MGMGIKNGETNRLTTFPQKIMSGENPRHRRRVQQHGRVRFGYQGVQHAMTPACRMPPGTNVVLNPGLDDIIPLHIDFFPFRSNSSATWAVAGMVAQHRLPSVAFRCRRRYSGDPMSSPDVFSTHAIACQRNHVRAKPPGHVRPMARQRFSKRLRLVSVRMNRSGRRQDKRVIDVASAEEGRLPM